MRNPLREAGRVLSKTNHGHIQSAHAAAGQVSDHLGAVLDALPTATTESADPTTEALQEAERSFGQLQQLVSAAIQEQFGSTDEYGSRRYCWVTDMYDKYAIYQLGGTYFSIPWAIADNVVQLGEPTEVVQGYVDAAKAIGDGDGDADDGVLAPAGVPSMESARYVTEAGTSQAIEIRESTAAPFAPRVVALTEKAVRKDGTANIKLIDAGWGSSGYYPAAVLKRDGPKIFTANTHMYLDHPTETEEAERPERSIKDLAAVLSADARWLDKGPAGPGLYAEAKVAPEFAKSLDFLAPFTGVSIRASGNASMGEAEGRKGLVIEALTTKRSVDFVTQAGRGGAVVPLTESTRATPAATKEAPMSEQALQEAQTKITAMEAELNRLRERAVLQDARHQAQAALAAQPLHELTQERLTTELVARAPLTEGALDSAAFAALIETAIKTALAEVAVYATAGRVVNLGETRELSEADARTELVASFVESGYSQATAEKMADGRL